jgi:hypothetical protein
MEVCTMPGSFPVFPRTDLNNLSPQQRRDVARAIFEALLTDDDVKAALKKAVGRKLTDQQTKTLLKL